MSEEKTEDPTEARKREARLKGQVVKSQDLVSAATLAASFAIIAALLPIVGKLCISLLTTGLKAMADVQNPLNALRLLSGPIFAIMSTALLPAMFGAALAGLAVNLSTAGLGFSPKAISPDLSKMNPLNGIKKWFSKKTLMEGLKLLLKTYAMCWVIWDFWREEHGNILLVSRFSMDQFRPQIALIINLAWRLVAVQAVFGLIDFGLQYYQHRQSMKMSKQEVKDEYKKQEGDPLIKAQRRARARRMIKNAGVQNLAKASVVITNPTHLAVALEYNMSMDAPVVIAKGADHVAFEIRKRARELKIPIVEDKPLARALFPVDIDQIIPGELFRAVAEILLSVRDAEDYL